jgi:hypothetical protein
MTLESKSKIKNPRMTNPKFKHGLKDIVQRYDFFLIFIFYFKKMKKSERAAIKKSWQWQKK